MSAALAVTTVDLSPVKAFRGMGRVGGATDRLLAERSAGEGGMEVPRSSSAGAVGQVTASYDDVI